MKIQKRRRIENKTDYGKRIKFLKSSNPRVTFRKTNRYILSQYIESKEAQDKIIINLSSKALLKHGWPKEFEGSLKSIPASYLLGYLVGHTIKKHKLTTPILDFGMIALEHRNKTFAFIKGIIDSGIEISCDKENFPEKEKIEGKNLKKDFTKHFEQIKLKIAKE